MSSVVKKKLAAPVKKFTCCVTGGKDRDLWGKYRGKRGKCGRPRGNASHRSSYTQDPSIRCSYQADLEKERKQREVMNAQKNAERAAMRAHFRRKYQLPRNKKDSSQLRAMGRKVSLPRELAAMVQPDTSKDDAYSLLSAFQGLSFNMGFLSGEKHSKTPTPVNTDCKVM